MSSEEHKIDVRKAGQSIGNKSVDQRYSANMDRTKMKTLQASVILAIASFGASAESIQIFVSSNLQQPTGDLSGSDNVFPPGIVFSGAAAEAAVFLTGLFLSVASAFFDINNPKLTGVALITTLILAWYYFITLVVAQPAFNWDKDLMPPIPPAGGWDTEFREEVTFWMGHYIPNLVICAVMLGFQYYATYNLYRCQTDEAANDNPRPNIYRYMVYSFFDTILGVGVLTAAGWTRVQEGPNSLSAPVVYPPTFIYYPDVAVMSGLFTMIWGALNMLYSFVLLGGTHMPVVTSMLQGLSVIYYLWIFGFHTLMQISLISPTLDGVAARVALLFVPVAFAPVLFASEATKRMADEIK
mmetsp:Transcript_32593/g.52961  ORF Transcript_32593/g.52961 Transcript_32593/m.52961 type:complete len:355 (-) Transcript_32593:80-1144(-)|eukprot:jgi/Bigna1/88601/estExt_fgenesh1_pg.C_340144